MREVGVAHEALRAWRRVAATAARRSRGSVFVSVLSPLQLELRQTSVSVAAAAAAAAAATCVPTTSY